MRSRVDLRFSVACRCGVEEGKFLQLVATSTSVRGTERTSYKYTECKCACVPLEICSGPLLKG